FHGKNAIDGIAERVPAAGYTKGTTLSRGAPDFHAARSPGDAELVMQFLLLGSSRDFGSEVGLFLLDAFAELQADHAGDLDRSAGGLFGFLERLGDGEVRVDDESLRQQRDFLEELAHAAFDHLLDDV